MKKSLTMLLSILTVAALATPSMLRAHEGHEHDKKETASKTTERAKPAATPAAKPYKLDTCLVSDEKLGEMGKPVVFEYQGQEIKLCCKACRKKFDKAPATYLKKLEPKK